MNLYFFINIEFRGYLHNYLNMPLFPEGKSSYSKEEILSIEEIINKRKPIINPKDLNKIISLESSSPRAVKNYELYNELVYVGKHLISFISLKYIKYLFIIANNYFLENHVIHVLDKLMHEQGYFWFQIKRITSYKKFREWVTFKPYLNDYKTYIKYNNDPYNKTDLYNIYIMELYQSCMISHLHNKKNIFLI